MTFLWTKISGPGTVTFTDATNPNTHVTFSLIGVYVLRLTATNPVGSTFDEITIIVDFSCASTIPDPVLTNCN